MLQQPKFTTIAEMFLARAGSEYLKSKPAYSRKIAGRYESVAYSELREMVEKFAVGLLELGIKRGDRVGIISENRLEWVVASFAISCIGAIDAPIFPMLSAKQVEYIYENCGAACIIVSNAFQLGKVLKAQSRLPELRQIIVMNDDAKGSNLLVKTMSETSAFGETAMSADARARLFADAVSVVEPEDLAAVIYTSGTTGDPKGVMLTHANLCANIEGALQAFRINSDDIFLSYLPLCHSFERIGGFYCSFAAGAATAFAESIEKVADNIREVQPTMLTSVPRLFERIRQKIFSAMEKEKPLKRQIFRWAVETGKKSAAIGGDNGSRNAFVSIKLKIANKLVFAKIKERLGGRLRMFISGGAPLSVEVADFFTMLGFTIIEGYGLTEASPVLTVNYPGDEEIGSVGKPLANVEIMLGADGEIFGRGPNIMKGYWNDPVSTAEAIDADGWLHTGDIGAFTQKGNLKITDRKKHIFVSSGGKNIAPTPIEAAAARSKYIEYCVLIGEGREYCAALISPHFDELQNKISELAGLSREEMAASAAARRLIESELSLQLLDFSKFERVRRFVIVAEPFSIETGELTPKFSVKRSFVEKKYEHHIKTMYASAAGLTEH